MSLHSLNIHVIILLTVETLSEDEDDVIHSGHVGQWRGINSTGLSLHVLSNEKKFHNNNVQKSTLSF
jgi:hypothetical protein